ncbi:MAG: hypothetical protein H0U71_01930 [Gammaproteobacteria bacterium]|nr:hypothetical protein [Gammaproteobacteria bacterium]
MYQLGLFIFIFFYAASLHAEPTKIIIYQAYTQESALNSHLFVAQRYAGSCWTRSLANPGRSDAWRCQASNVILDPCFQDGNSLACVTTPWSHKATILDLDAPLHRKTALKIDAKTAQPWAVELANGLHCTFLTGASVIINNMRLNYTCDRYRYSILGQIDRSHTPWTVHLYDFHYKIITKIPVTTIWF